MGTPQGADRPCRPGPSRSHHVDIETRTRRRPRKRPEHTSVVPHSASQEERKAGMEGKGSRMYARFKIVGIGLAIAGIVFVGVGGYTYMKTQQGAHALAAFSTAQNVKLSYDDQGQLKVGTVEDGQAILSLLQNDWGYAVDKSELNPNDPVVNTASEYMVQMATIAYHTLNGTQTVVLPETVTAADGTVYQAGSYD